MSQQSFKVVLVGEGGVGKTTFMTLLLTGVFEKKYVATLGVEVHPIVQEFANYTRTFNVWDTAGQEKFGGLQEGYYIGADIGILMVDMTSRLTYKSIPQWINKLRQTVPNIPIVLVANKVDVADLKVSAGEILHIAQAYGLHLVNISCKSGYRTPEVIECLNNIIDYPNNIIDYPTLQAN